MSKMTNNSDITNYVTGGRGEFTLTSRKTDTSLTYRTRWARDHLMMFVYHLSGPNNDNDADYSYTGVLVGFEEGEDIRLRTTKRSTVTVDAPSFRALNWLLKRLNTEPLGELPETIEFRHSGSCCRCGRKLTTPQSIDAGIGPVCGGRR